MQKFRLNKKYFVISLYVCAVLALTIIGVTISVYLPNIFAAIGSFFSIITPILLGLVFAYLITPILSFVEKKIMRYVDRKVRPPYIKRIIALIITYIILTAVLTLFGFAIFPQLIGNFDTISENLTTNIVNLYEMLRNLLLKLFKVDIGSATANIENLTDSLIGYLGSIGAEFGRTVFNIFTGLFLSFFVLLHHEQLLTGFKKLTAAVFPPRAYNGIMRTMRMTDNIFGKFFIGKIFDSLIIGLIVLATLGFFYIPIFPDALRMPYPYLMAAVIAITNIIPYIGPFIGAVPCVLLVFIDDNGGVTSALFMLIVIVAVQLLDANLINPKILGKTIGISSLWVVVSVIILGNFWGAVGMIIAVPLFSVIYNLVRDLTVKRLKKMNLPTDTEAYEPTDAEPAITTWTHPTESPDPHMLSDSLDGTATPPPAFDPTDEEGDA